MRRLSHRLGRSAVIPFAISVAFPLLCAAQDTPPPAAAAAPPPPTVYSNPRAGADDPRVGLKGGLYDAGQAAFGMELVTTLPKPAGFAPGDNATATTAATPEPP